MSTILLKKPKKFENHCFPIVLLPKSIKLQTQHHHYLSEMTDRQRILVQNIGWVRVPVPHLLLWARIFSQGNTCEKQEQEEI